MKAEEIKDRESLAAWLETRSREEAMMIAHRAALRVLPLWGAAMGEDWARKRDLTALPILRCGIVSSVAAYEPTADISSAANAAANAAFAANDSNAVDDAATAANAAVASTAIGPATNVASFAVDYSVATTTDESAFSLDARLLESGVGLKEADLWPNTAPHWFGDAEATMLKLWTNEPHERWEFWRRWWEGAKAGNPIDPQLQLAIVEGIDDDTWDDPDAVAARIAEIEAEYREQQSWNEGSITLDLEIPNERDIAALRVALEATQKNADALEARFSATGTSLDDLSVRLTNLTDQYEKQSSKIGADFDALKENFAEKFEGALAAFTEQQAIKAPVELWKEKEAEHHAKMGEARKAFIVGLFGLAALIAFIIGCLALGGDTLAKLFTPVGCDPALKPELCKGFSFRGMVVTGSVLTLMTLALWYTRLQMKEYLSERHLTLDARERQAFVQAYIGLLAEGDSSEEAKDQRALVYAALFRPSTDGIIKEDGGFDPSMSAAISKLLAGK